MSDWRPHKIGELGRVVTGKTPPSTHPELLSGEVPFITPGDMSEDTRNISTERFVSTAWDSKGRLLLPEGSVCVVCIGMTIGKVCMTSRPSHTNQQINSVIVDTERFDPHFVFYSMRTLAGEIRVRATGAQTRIVNKTVFSEIAISAPTLEIQRRIALILGTYDDLIEVNRRRVAILEEMARRLFEEWFVRFRFPGYETVSILDTPDGPLPEAWRWGTIGDLAAIGGRSINPAAFPNEVFAHHSIPAFDDGRNPATDQGDTIKSNKLAFQAPAILVSKLNPRFPRVWYIPNDTPQRQIASTEFVPLVPGETNLAWLYAVVRSKEFAERLTAMAGGTSTSHQRVKPRDVLNTPIAIPSRQLLIKAEQVLAPQFEMVRVAEAANRNLAATRDLLLPRVISGQLSLKAAERQLEDAA